MDASRQQTKTDRESRRPGSRMRRPNSDAGHRRRRDRRRTGLVLAGLLIFSCGCGGTSARFEGLGPEGDFLEAKELFDRGRCLQAIQIFESFLSENPGSSRVDDALYYLGLSRKCLDEHILAREEFDRLLREFPQSEFREDAEWERALSFYERRHSPDRDPEPTEQSVRAFEAYLRHYPSGAHAETARELLRASYNDLAVKAYENGLTYLRTLGKAKASTIYFEKSIELLGDSSVAHRAMASLIKAYAKSGEPGKALEWKSRLLEFATPERISERPELEGLLREVEGVVDASEAGK